MVQRVVAQVAVEQTTYHFDRLYSYDVGEFADELCCGCRVLVPFGKGNRCRQGIVMRIDRVSDTASYKSIVSMLDRQPLLNKELLDLAIFLKNRTFCTLFDAVRAMVPTGLCMYVKPVYTPIRFEERAMPALTDEEKSLYKLACSLYQKTAEGVTGEKLLSLAGLQEAQLPDALVKKGVLERREDAFRRAGDAAQRMARATFPSEELDEVLSRQRCTPKQKEVLELLAMAGAASVKEVCYLAGVTPAVTNTLAKKGLLEFFEREMLRSPVSAPDTVCRETIALSDEQHEVLEQLCTRYREPDAACALLHGVTGSGKTQVYMSLIDRVLADGKQVLVLVPEISLTPQTMQLFIGRYGKQVAVLHSGLSVGERMDEWKRIRRGDARIVVGTRSAVFAPCDNLGLIVMDEEQEHTYKSESNPRYHARDVAKFRCAHHKALLLLTSATPGIESYYAAKSGRYSLHTLTKRYGDALLPQVEVADMRLQMGETELLGDVLIQELSDCLQRGKQAILLLNRRGYQTFVSCRSCGKVMTCPSCSISMTYHRANRQMMCHYCGHMQPPLHHCPDCGSDKIRYSGQGTQRLEEELERLFPQARVLRMDTDTTASRFSYDEKFRAFGAGDYDIMVGTQMVAKGLDFPNVALVGVLSADRSLYEGDFRSYETSFSLLTQVVGRAGRRGEAGKAVIQTTVPEHYVIQLASEQDYPAFYETEIAARRMMKYPPFADLCLFGFVGAQESAVRQAATRFLEQLRQTMEKPEYAGIPLIALDPTPAVVARAAGKYRYKLLVKLKNTAQARQLIAELLQEFPQKAENRGVTLFADMNPLTIM
ncbi:MAG: primosomal protein N' [Clostridia bacterium]|nr:primosomal protein N' [Clostridia bacterium]